MLQKFAIVKYDVFLSQKFANARSALALRDIWRLPLARQVLAGAIGVVAYYHYHGAHLEIFGQSRNWKSDKKVCYHVPLAEVDSAVRQGDSIGAEDDRLVAQAGRQTEGGICDTLLKDFPNLKSIMKINWRATVVFAKLHMITMFT